MFIRIQAEESEKEQIIDDLKLLVDTKRYEIIMTFEQKEKLIIKTRSRSLLCL